MKEGREGIEMDFSNSGSTYFKNQEIFDTFQESEQYFSWNVKFNGANYNEKRKVLDDITDEITDNISLEQFERSNVLCQFLREIAKNAFDHNDIGAQISFEYIKDINKNQMHFHFLIVDEGEGFDYEKTNYDEWNKKGDQNFGIGLSIIKNAAEVLNIDLQLHSQGKIYPINDLGLQSHITSQEKFGYEGYGIFEAK